MPTILVGRIAAGHARPDDSWSESSATSLLQFRSSLSSQSDSVDTGAGIESDISPHITLDLENGLEDSRLGLDDAMQTCDLLFDGPIRDINVVDSAS